MDSILKAFGILSLLVISGCGGSPAPKIQFTEQHKLAALAALSDTCQYENATIELSDQGYVVATIDVYPLLIGNPERYATNAIMAIRNAIYSLPNSDKKWNYRVSLNGPSPGPDLISRIGSARFLGNGVTWDPGK